MGQPDGRDYEWLELAIEESRRCPPSDRAYSVGAVIVDERGTEVARGHSRESGAHVHAEEAALGKVPAGDPRLPAATIYASLEPCSRRASRPLSCTELIITAGIGRVVFAWREPDIFVPGADGRERLARAGVAVRELPELAGRARAVNAHLWRPSG
jgi:diaminohydroxyphosphoribosylaminopyrimidine deaminase / 5-amino-6-(5-phosphoribosylamino)uracil reductase